jgi:hypothetical protein
MGLPLTVEQMERLPSFDREWRSLAPEERDLIDRALRRAQLVPRLATRRTVTRRFGRWRVELHAVEVGGVSFLLLDAPSLGRLILLTARIVPDGRRDDDEGAGRLAPAPVTVRLSHAYRRTLLAEALVGRAPRSSRSRSPPGPRQART